MANLTKEKIALDDKSLLAYLKDEDKAGKVTDFLKQAETGKIRVFMDNISLGLVLEEIYQKKYSIDSALEIINQLPTEFCDITQKIISQAVYLAVDYSLSCEEAIILALAKEKVAKLLTSNKKYKLVEDKIPIIWL